MTTSAIFAEEVQLLRERTAQLETLLRRAWCRVEECVCHGERGSADRAELDALAADIDAALPLVRS